MSRFKPTSSEPPSHVTLTWWGMSRGRGGDSRGMSLVGEDRLSPGSLFPGAMQVTIPLPLLKGHCPSKGPLPAGSGVSQCSVERDGQPMERLTVNKEPAFPRMVILRSFVAPPGVRMSVCPIGVWVTVHYTRGLLAILPE